MPQPFSTGPVHWYVSIAGSAFGYLGTIEGPTEPDFDPQYEPLFNDLSGTKIPFDTLFENEQAFLSGTFTRWTEAVYAAMAAALPRAGVLVPRGVSVPGSIGTVMNFEGVNMRVAIRYPYSDPTTPWFKPAMATQPPGYRFMNVFKVKHRRRGGTGANKLFIAMHCLPAFNPATQGSLLYDHDMSGLPLPN